MGWVLPDIREAKHLWRLISSTYALHVLLTRMCVTSAFPCSSLQATENRMSHSPYEMKLVTVQQSPSEKCQLTISNFLGTWSVYPPLESAHIAHI